MWFAKAERRGDEAPLESEMTEAIEDAEADKENEFVAWILPVDEKLAKRYENERELKAIENHV